MTTLDSATPGPESVESVANEPVARTPEAPSPQEPSPSVEEATSPMEEAVIPPPPEPEPVLEPNLEAEPTPDAAPTSPEPSTSEEAEAPAPAKPRPYVSLHTQTQYSVLEAASKIPDIIKRAVDNNMPALALTDGGSMYGAVEFFNGCKAAGIKPIIGCKVFTMEGDNTDRSGRKPLHDVVLLVQNQTGYENLCQIVSDAQMNGFYYKPRTTWDLLKKHNEGLIALTGGLHGPLAHSIIRGNMQEARDRTKWMKEVFGDRLYLELQDHGEEAEYRFSLEVVKISQEMDIPLVITNASRFTKPEDNSVLSILQCLQTGKTINDPGGKPTFSPEYCLKNGDEIAQRFTHIDRSIVEEALNNTLAVADRIEFELQQGTSILPNFPLPEGKTEAEYLNEVVYEHARKRYGQDLPQEVIDRLEYEQGIINQMGFPAYFLIVWDFMNWSRNNDIPVGPGRGSAAGSLVAYVLGITNIDPLEHNLLFERFLNPERVSMPDIDIDFCIERRGEVIDYVNDRYGSECVCQIGTFGTLAARAALKAVARVHEIPFADSDRWAKMIPATPGTKLKEALVDGMELAMECDKDPQLKELVDLALSIEGTVFSIGTHAAGVVISKDPLHTVVPLQKSKDGQMISQYPMGDLEKLGLLKMDFLGLRNLTIINNTVTMVEEFHGTKLDMDYLPLDDEKVFSLLTSGDTDGVFQLESGGMKSLVKNLKPSVFEDINALVALYRPGPLNSGMVDVFVDRKHGRAQITYDHPELEPILEATYGTIVYQEQIMQVAQTLAGYSLGQADLLRRAMGKKKAEVMAREREGFIKGSIDHGVDEGLANKLFDTMTEFAAYCFNRSHSAAYAFVAYQTAYLKAHYPIEYLSALLSSVSNDMDKIQHYMVTARRMGIAILPPDIQKSSHQFTPDYEAGKEHGAIRFGMGSIKNVGAGVVEAIIAKRNEEPFKDLEDFARRIDFKVLNRKTLESLVRCGAFDSFGVTRKQLFDNIDTVIRFAEKSQEAQITGQVSLFSMMGEAEGSGGFGGLMLSGNPEEEYTQDEIQADEKLLLGFYVSSHPLDDVVDTLPLMVSHTTRELKEVADGTIVLVGGLIENAVRKITKSGKPMLIGNLEDLAGSVEFVVFSNTLDTYGEDLEAGRKVLIKGKLQFRGDDGDNYSIVLNELKPLADCKPFQLDFVKVPTYEEVVKIGQVLASHKGETPVVLHFPDTTKIKVGHQFYVAEDFTPLVEELTTKFGTLVHAAG